MEIHEMDLLMWRVYLKNTRTCSKRVRKWLKFIATLFVKFTHSCDGFSFRRRTLSGIVDANIGWETPVSPLP